MDREKVIKGLECHAKGSKGCLFDCPYGNENGCQLLLCSDALALLKEHDETIKNLEQEIRDKNIRLKERAEQVDSMLKEQEAKPPAIMQDVEGIWSTCSICGHKLRPILAMRMDTYFPKFCPECGQAVKWND